MQKDFVDLAAKRHRGWPWPEDSWGLTPMYGDDGWCRGCGVPQDEQSGSLVLQRRGLTVSGAWKPNWRFDVICVERDLANDIANTFEVELREVNWAGISHEEAMQIVIPVTSRPWFDENALAARVLERHDRTGQRCHVCGTYRWLPLGWGHLPSVIDPSILEGHEIVACPEWFGDGWRAFRRLLVRRDLAELLQSASPRDFEIKEVAELAGVAGSAPDWGANRPAVAVPTAAVSQVFVAELLPDTRVQGAPSAAARRDALRARAMLEQSNGLVSADALAVAGQQLFEGGEVAEAKSLWRQAAAHGSAAAQVALETVESSGR